MFISDCTTSDDPSKAPSALIYRARDGAWYDPDARAFRADPGGAVPYVRIGGPAHVSLYGFRLDTPPDVWGTKEIYYIFVIKGDNSPTEIVTMLVNDGLSGVPPAPELHPPTVACKFIGRDVETKGRWTGVYGRDGYYVAQDDGPANPRLPAYATLAVRGSSDAVWAPTTADPRGLMRPGAPAQRRAACWFTFGNIEFEIHLTDGAEHRASFYFVDWDTKGVRSQSIAVRDARTGTVLDTQTVDRFDGGVYLSWAVRGDLVWRLVSLDPSSNAVVSAFFFDPPEINK